MNLFEFRLQAQALALSTLLSGIALLAQAGEEFSPKRIKTTSGVTYTMFPKGKLVFDFVVSRPARTQSEVYLCIPSAFTTPYDQVDGVYISNGLIGNAHGVNKELGGAMLIENGQCKLLSTNKGTMITEKFLNDVQRGRGSLFQQFLIVHDGKAASFKDKSRFQRRAVCETTKGTFGVVESDKPITFTTFNDDLVSIGIKEALYCDMGAWDEGWYRSGTTGEVTKIGLDRSLTNRQSNWLLMKAPKKLTPKKSEPKKLEPKKLEPKKLTPKKLEEGAGALNK
ncbi:hypothetical protein BH10CYA1_BH10CYA1_60170 [soil metagenome]